MMYPTYTPISEAIWFSRIPSSWNARKMRGLFAERTEKVSDKDYPALSVGKMGVVPQLESAVKTDNGDNRKLIIKGDFAINSRSDRKGSCGISQFNGSCSLIITVLQPREDFNPRFLHYLLRSHFFSEEFYRNGHGLVADLWTTKWDEMRNIFIPVPPRIEQDQIVRYLDWKVSRINKLIHGYQREIGLLEERRNNIVEHIVKQGINSTARMVDSGIEYIGVVPEHWRILLNHRLYKGMGRKFSGSETVLSLSQKDGLIPYEQMTERSLHTASYDNWQLVLPNDLVLNRFKAHLGVFFASKYRGIVTFHYGVYEPRMPLISEYYEALYHTNVYKRVFAGQSKGMTVGLQNLSDTDFFAVYTVYPPYEEQQEIVEAIRDADRQLQEGKKKIEKQISLLREYRTRLISDVVTGQIDVRGIVVPDFVPEEDTETAQESEEETEVDEDAQ